jgi:hypothetical protein
MDGEVLPVVEAVGERSYPDRPPRDGDVDRDGTVEQRLADMGYLEGP